MGEILHREVAAGVEVTVSDNGPGIPARRLGAALPALSSTKSSGFGLGLAICKDILSSLHASITADPPRTWVRSDVPYYPAMPATYVLATEDPELLRAWWVLIPPGRQVLTLEELAPPSVVPPGIPTVVILDASVVDRLPAALRSSPTIAVGEPGSSALDRARNLGPAKVVLSYDESRTRLAPLLPLVEELAERGAALDVVTERTRRIQPGTSAAGTRSRRGVDSMGVC